MNILVTGGSGFIGARLVGELLSAGHQVAIYDVVPSAAHPTAWICGDVRDREALGRAAGGRDAIVHLAAEHRDDPQSAALMDAVNVGGARNVVAAARAAGCRRIIFTSSAAVYPLDAREVSEDTPPRPYNRYGESKLAAEEIFRDWAQRTADAALVIVRACVVFGEGNRGNVYNLACQIARGRFVMVGAGRNRKSMAYVGNLTRFLALGLDLPAGVHLYNFADKPDLTMAELVGLMRDTLGPRGVLARMRFPLWAGLAAGAGCDVLARLTGRNYASSASRIRKFCAETTLSTARLAQTGFNPPYPLREALVTTLRREFGRPAETS